MEQRKSPTSASMRSQANPTNIANCGRNTFGRKAPRKKKHSSPPSIINRKNNHLSILYSHKEYIRHGIDRCQPFSLENLRKKGQLKGTNSNQAPTFKILSTFSRKLSAPMKVPLQNQDKRTWALLVPEKLFLKLSQSGRNQNDTYLLETVSKDSKLSTISNQ